MRILFLTTFLALALLSLVPLSADAQAYQPLAPIPGVSSGISFSQFVERIVVIALSIGAILAVLMLVVGGFEWMVSEAVHKKELGRERVRNAIFGLLILLAAVLVLNTINPQLINLNLAVQPLTLPTPNKDPRPASIPGDPQPDAQGRCPDGFLPWDSGTGGRGCTKKEKICATPGQEPVSDGSGWYYCGDTKAIAAEREANPAIYTANKGIFLTYCQESRLTKTGTCTGDIFTQGVVTRYFKTQLECEKYRGENAVSGSLTKVVIVADCSITDVGSY